MCSSKNYLEKGLSDTASKLKESIKNRKLYFNINVVYVYSLACAKLQAY